MNEQEVKKRFENIEKRLDLLENKKIKTLTHVKKSKNLEGISKDIHELIESGFFDLPKSIGEIAAELKRKGFFGQIQRVDSAVRKSFFKSKKLLDRVNENGWKYFKRK